MFVVLWETSNMFSCTCSIRLKCTYLNIKTEVGLTRMVFKKLILKALNDQGINFDDTSI